MKVSKARLENVFGFLGEEVEAFSISYARKLLGLRDPDSIAERILLSAEWMLLGERDGECEIEDGFLEDWNSFVRRILALDAAYGYAKEGGETENGEGEREVVRDLRALNDRRQRALPTDHPPYRLLEQIPAVTGQFIGRTRALEEIHRHLERQNVLVLYGLGGIGKSELAKAYINGYRSCYRQILFCSFHENLQETFIDDSQVPVENLLFVNSGKRGERGWYFRKKQRILRKITDEKTLLVIDNFDVLSDKRLGDITELPCKLLFTSRTSAEQFGLPGIRIEALDLFSEQRELFFRYYGREIREDRFPLIDELIRRLQGHTLTIKLYASYLAEQEDGFNRLEGLLLGKDEQKLQKEAAEKQIQDIFRLTNLSRTERVILRYLSVMPVYGIDILQFQNWCRVRNRESIERLAAKGLVELSRRDGILFMHPLVAAAARRIEKVSFQNCRPYVKSLCRLCHQTWTKSAREKKTYERYVYVMLGYLQDTEPEPFTDLIYLVSGSWQLGYFEEGEKFGLKLCDYGVKKYGTASSQAASIRHILGALYDNWGKRKQAVQWFRSAYENYKDAEEPHPLYYALVCHKFGRVLRYEGKYRESEQVLYKAAERLARQLEEDPRQADVGYVEEMGAGALMDLYMELAELYLNWERPDEAMKWLERREKEFEIRKLGRIWNSSQWNLYYRMGICQKMLGDREKAEKALEEALYYAQKYFIKDSPYIRMVKEELSKVCSEGEAVR